MSWRTALQQTRQELTPPAMTQEQRRELDNQIILSNLRRGRQLCYMALLVFGGLLGFHLLNWDRVDTLTGDKSYGLVVMRMLWLVWAVFAWVATNNIPDSVSGIRPGHRFFNLFGGMTPLVLAGLQAGLGLVYFTNITVYLGLLFINVTFLRYNSARMLLAVLPGCLALVGSSWLRSDVDPSAIPLAVMGAAMSGVALFIGQMLYVSSAQTFLQIKIIEKQKADLEKLGRTKSQLLSSVSHELRTPLTSVVGYSKLIQRDVKNLFTPLAASDPKLKLKAQRISENLEIIVGESQRLTRLINEVLDLAKIEAGRVQWRDEICQVGDLVRLAAQAAHGEFADRPEVSLEVLVQDPLPTVLADRDRLLQVLINLLNNASKFTERGRVIIGARATPKGWVRVEVNDTGPGIPPENLEQVFDQFFQVTGGDTLSDKPAGTGLGLSICKQIVEHYQGRIWVESQMGRGSSFIIELPAAA